MDGKDLDGSQLEANFLKDLPDKRPTPSDTYWKEFYEQRPQYAPPKPESLPVFITRVTLTSLVVGAILFYFSRWLRKGDTMEKLKQALQIGILLFLFFMAIYGLNRSESVFSATCILAGTAVYLKRF